MKKWILDIPMHGFRTNPSTTAVDFGQTPLPLLASTRALNGFPSQSHHSSRDQIKVE